MSSMQWIWIIVGIIILLIIVGILAALGRRRGRAGQETADRQEAATMRVAARDTDLDARESRAAAAGTAAEAEQAQIDAERLRIQAEERNTAASAQTEKSARVRRHADAIDPDVDRKHGDDDA